MFRNKTLLLFKHNTLSVPPAWCVVSRAPTLLDSELTELPGQPWLWVSMAWEGAGAGSGNVEVAFIQDMHRGIKNPKCRVCWPAAQPLRGPSWVTQKGCS